MIDQSNTKNTLKLIFQSYGLKTSKPIPKADLYFDCRCVVDGSGAKGIGGTGDSKAMQDYVKQMSPMSINGFVGQLREGIARIPDRRSDRPDPFDEPFVVLCMCAHGIHRSRSVKNILADRFKADGYNVVVE